MAGGILPFDRWGIFPGLVIEYGRTFPVSVFFVAGMFCYPRSRRPKFQATQMFRIDSRQSAAALPIVLLLSALVWSIVPASAMALQEEPRLRKRIAELEAENRALRKVIAGIREQIQAVPAGEITPEKNPALRIVVLEGNWGDSSLQDIQKVCLSSAGAIWQEMPGDVLAPILVSRSESGPISLYKRGEGNEYQVRLDTANRAWAQCAYQFSHEFCHLLCNYRSVRNPQLWFEESLCEAASLFALRRMGETWKTNPPYSNWKPYSAALTSYADQRIRKYDGRTDSLKEFYTKHQDSLEKTGTNRDLNGYIAIRLLQTFEKKPAGWQAIRHINLGPPEENMTFPGYLQGWHRRVPAKHKPLVEDIAAEFGIPLTR